MDWSATVDGQLPVIPVLRPLWSVATGRRPRAFWAVLARRYFRCPRNLPRRRMIVALQGVHIPERRLIHHDPQKKKSKKRNVLICSYLTGTDRGGGSPPIKKKKKKKRTHDLELLSFRYSKWKMRRGVKIQCHLARELQMGMRAV